jgi:TolB protein
LAQRAPVELAPGKGRDDNPNWAPDGIHLVFCSTRSGTPQIWTMLADGTHLRQLTTQGVNEMPVWSR